MRRTEIAAQVAGLVGSDVMAITAPGTGWPAHGTLLVGDEPLPVSLYTGPVTRSNRGRDEQERRFQNPGQNRPIILEAGRYPLLIGLFEDDSLLPASRALLVLADPFRRAGRETRYSVFASVASLMEASATGWSEDRSTSGEIVRCFFPPLLPIVVASLREEAVPPGLAIQAVIDGSGLLEAAGLDIPAAAERARRAATALVRDARFSRRVINAYGGECAMCGIDADLVQAAHIYPASAPGSRDEPWNGIALCPNHHDAFDRHMLAVDPDSRAILLGPVIAEQAPVMPGMRAFADATFPQLASPTDRDAFPAAQMFLDRYRYFPTAYTWMRQS